MRNAFSIFSAADGKTCFEKPLGSISLKPKEALFLLLLYSLPKRSDLCEQEKVPFANTPVLSTVLPQLQIGHKQISAPCKSIISLRSEYSIYCALQRRHFFLKTERIWWPLFSTKTLGLPVDTQKKNTLFFPGIQLIFWAGISTGWIFPLSTWPCGTFLMSCSAVIKHVSITLCILFERPAQFPHLCVLCCFVT